MSKKELTFEQFVKAERGTTVEITMTGTIGEDGLVDVHGKKFPNDVLIYADTFYEIPKPFKVGDLASAGPIVHGIVEEIEQSGYLLIYGYHSKRGKIVTYRNHPDDVKHLNAVPEEPTVVEDEEEDEEEDFLLL